MVTGSFGNREAFLLILLCILKKSIAGIRVACPRINWLKLKGEGVTVVNMGWLILMVLVPHKHES